MMARVIIDLLACVRKKFEFEVFQTTICIFQYNLLTMSLHLKIILFDL